MPLSPWSTSHMGEAVLRNLAAGRQKKMATGPVMVAGCGALLVMLLSCALAACPHANGRRVVGMAPPHGSPDESTAWYGQERHARHRSRRRKRSHADHHWPATGWARFPGRPTLPTRWSSSTSSLCVWRVAGGGRALTGRVFPPAIS